MKRSRDEIESGDLSNKRLKQTSPIDQIIQNPGFQLITEKILVNLPFEDIIAFQLVNKSCKKILDDPMVWIKKWISKGLSKKNQGKWIKAIQLTNNPNLMNTNWMKINIILYIQKILHWNDDFDIPCYINEKTVEKFSNVNFDDENCIQCWKFPDCLPCYLKTNMN